MAHYGPCPGKSREGFLLEMTRLLQEQALQLRPSTGKVETQGEQGEAAAKPPGARTSQPAELFLAVDGHYRAEQVTGWEP